MKTRIFTPFVLLGCGIAVASSSLMITHHRPSTSPQPGTLLRWIFRRDADAITCELGVGANRGCDVCLVPHWDVSASLIEHFDAPVGALLRHAEIARHLREHGWVLTAHVSAVRTPVAA